MNKYHDKYYYISFQWTEDGQGFQIQYLTLILDLEVVTCNFNNTEPIYMNTVTCNFN